MSNHKNDSDHNDEPTVDQTFAKQVFNVTIISVILYVGSVILFVI